MTFFYSFFLKIDGYEWIGGCNGKDPKTHEKYDHL